MNFKHGCIATVLQILFNQPLRLKRLTAQLEESVPLLLRQFEVRCCDSPLERLRHRTDDCRELDLGIRIGCC